MAERNPVDPELAAEIEADMAEIDGDTKPKPRAKTTDHIGDCPDCSGTGLSKTDNTLCARCGGSGHILAT